MLFSSLEFLYLYLPLTLLLYYITPIRFRNLTLFLLSLVFYGWGEPSYLWVMLLTVAIDYAAGWLMERAGENRKKKRLCLIAAISANLFLLGLFKYADFAVSILRAIPFWSEIPYPHLSLPIGISFYTFQALSYVIDVYRGEVKAQKNPISFGTYVTLFPQLIAGPIVRYREIDRELTERKTDLNEIGDGITLFLIGLCKKVFLANGAGEIWKTMRDLPATDQTVLGVWFGIVCFGLQIYFDFSGYSDMAVGLGRLFGFHFPENFRYPFTAESITDFWRRWHITLSSWFREYVYFPLGGNRKGKARTYLNLLIVWLLTGLWHGANWNFVLWGLFFCFFLILEKAFLGEALAKCPKVLRRLYTLVVLQFSWWIFAFDGSASTLSAEAAIRWGKAMLGIGVPFAVKADLYEIGRNAVFFLLLLLGCTPYPKKLCAALKAKWRGFVWVEYAMSVGALLLCTAYLVNSGYNPFLYFRF